MPFLPFLLAFLIAESSRRGTGPTLPLGTTLILIAVALALWWLTAESINAVVAKRRNLRLLIWWDIAAQGLLLGGLAALCMRTSWARDMPGTTLTLAPYFCGLAIHWATYAVGSRAVLGKPWTRMGMLVYQVRFTTLPLLFALSALYDLSSGISGHLLGSIPVSLQLFGMAVLALTAVTVLPIAIVRLWGAKPLPAGETSTLLHEACARSGVTGLQVRSFSIPHSREYNATLAIAPLPRWRYILISHGLLEDLPREELVAILGHELGHHHHRHILLRCVFLLAVMSLGHLIASLIELGHLPILGQMLAKPWGPPLLMIAVAIAVWRGPFALLSRGCERQADLAGASLAGSPLVMASALLRVARLSKEPEDAASWSHYSDAVRADFMRRVAADPSLSRKHHFRMRLSLVVLILVMLASLALNLWLHPSTTVRNREEARTELHSWAERDYDLQKGIVEADNGDPTALGKWYQRAKPLARQNLAALTLALAVDGKNTTDDAEIYRLRYRLMAFSGIDSGHPGLNLEIENSLAYGLVAGIDEPTEQDLRLARRLLANLEVAMQTAPNHAVYDTIGCIYFRISDWTRARDAFQNALARLDQAKVVAEDQHSFARTLYQARLKASLANLEAASSGGQLSRLPLNVGVIGPEVSNP